MPSTTTTTSNRSRRRIGRILLAAAVAACALPSGASAATVELFGDTVLHRGTGEERNSVSVRAVSGALIVSDSAGLFNLAADPRLGCVSIDRETLRCPRKRFEARMGSGDDTAGPINTNLPVEINGESGNDTYNAGNPSFLTNVEFVGGSGLDTASYAGSGGTGGGQGVHIATDGQPNDGRRGLDTDNIGRDVEELVGSGFADEITAAGDRTRICCSKQMFVTGGQGNDVLRAGSGGDAFILFRMGTVADGADKIIGGLADSHVFYADRTRPVNATLNFGGADDGEAGEGDEILGGHESVSGGRAGDTLRAPFGSKAPHSISGREGNDTIDGADGPDTLTGGAGGDSIRAFGGNDRVFLRDGETDTVNCGFETDTVVEVDAIDNVGNDCENGTVGVLRLAPKALRAEAGQTARLKLSWRHPRSWRQLRRVELRLYRGESRVGAVAIRPRSLRIGDRGGVTVLRRSSRITRKGKTVGARLALRLGRRLAGRRLRVEVAAVDVRGTRQLEPMAGSIRVAG